MKGNLINVNLLILYKNFFYVIFIYLVKKKIINFDLLDKEFDILIIVR